MESSITTRTVGDVTIIDSAGRLTLDEGSQSLRGYRSVFSSFNRFFQNI
jgi:hypothetical protein